MPDAAVGGHRGLELLEVRTQDEALASHHLDERGTDLGADGRVLRAEVEEGDLHTAPAPKVTAA